MPVFTFTCLGWLLLSVKNNKSSIILTPVIGLFIEKFKNTPLAITCISGVFPGV